MLKILAGVGPTDHVERSLPDDVEQRLDVRLVEEVFEVMLRGCDTSVEWVQKAAPTILVQTVSDPRVGLLTRRLAVSHMWSHSAECVGQAD